MPKKNENNILLQMLITAPEYRAYLREKFIYLKKIKSAGFSYQKFADLAGFSSKGFVKDVADGKKKLTNNSLEKFVKGLNLKGAEANFFRMLVCLDDKIPYKNWSQGLLQERIAAVRQRLSSGDQKKNETTIYKKQLWPLLYAALGNESEGASITEVSNRTKTPTAICCENLLEMTSLGILWLDNRTNRFHCKDFHLIYKGNGDFQTFYLNTLETIRSTAQKSFADANNLFMGSAFSVKQSRMAEFSEKLKVLMVDFIDEMEDPLGDSVVMLSVGLAPANYDSIKLEKNFDP